MRAEVTVVIMHSDGFTDKTVTVEGDDLDEIKTKAQIAACMGLKPKPGLELEHVLTRVEHLAIYDDGEI